VGDKNIVELGRRKIKRGFIYLLCVFTLMQAAFHKNLQVVALNIKTGTCHRFRSAKKFQLHINPPLNTIEPISRLSNAGEGRHPATLVF
jgi:hypothetical protein